MPFNAHPYVPSHKLQSLLPSWNPCIHSFLCLCPTRLGSCYIPVAFEAGFVGNSPAHVGSARLGSSAKFSSLALIVGPWALQYMGFGMAVSARICIAEQQQRTNHIGRFRCSTLELQIAPKWDCDGRDM